MWKHWTFSLTVVRIVLVTFGTPLKPVSNLGAQLAFKQLRTSHLALHQWLTHFESNPVAFYAAVCCECGLLSTQLSGFSFKMRTRLTVCVGTGGPHEHEGGLQGLEQGGAEERGPTETEERRQTGQPSKASSSSSLMRQGGHLMGICKEWPMLSYTTDDTRSVTF